MKKSVQEAIMNELPDADYPDFEPGDKIRVLTEQDIGGQKRDRKFEGVCIVRKGGGPDETFKVRKESFGVGVERIFPLHSPIIESIEIIRKGKVNQAKLNYLEGRSAKESRIEEERVDLDEVNDVNSSDNQQDTVDDQDSPAENAPGDEETSNSETAQAEKEEKESMNDDAEQQEKVETS